MRTLTYATRGRWFTAGGSCVVTEQDHEVATISVEPGGLFGGGPTWTWASALGPEWTMTAESGDRAYEVTRTDDVALGRLSRPWGSSRMLLEAADGRVATLASRHWFQRTQHLELPDGEEATVARRTAAFTLTTLEQWELRVPASLTDPLHTLVLALPLALDHRRRRQEQTATAGGGGA